MAKTTLTGFQRWYGSNGKNATPSVPFQAIKISFDPTQVSADTGKVYPKGAIPLFAISFGGATGGTNPTVDIGTLAASDAFTQELPADAYSAPVPGTTSGVELTVDTPIFAGVGASAATGGTVTAIVVFTMSDDGSA